MHLLTAKSWEDKEMEIKIYSYLQPAAQPNTVPLVVDYTIGGL